jgi:hypothetical protein
VAGSGPAGLLVAATQSTLENSCERFRRGFKPSRVLLNALVPALTHDCERRKLVL